MGYSSYARKNGIRGPLTSAEFNKKYGVPLTRKFNGHIYKIAAASKNGGTTNYADGVKAGLADMGFKCRVVKYGEDYYVYAYLPK